MANDKSTTNFTDNTLPESSTLTASDSLSTGFSLSAGYLSYLNDDLGKEWERNLLSDPADLNKSGREQTRETLNLLWDTSELTAARESYIDLTAFPKMNAMTDGQSASEAAQPTSTGTSTAEPNPSQNTAPRRTSGTQTSSGASYSNSGTRTSSGASYSNSGTRTSSGASSSSFGKRTSSSASTSFGSTSRPSYNTYGSTRTGSGASSGRNTAATAVARPKTSVIATLFRIFAVIIIMDIILAGVFYVLARKPFTGIPGSENFTIPGTEDITIPNIEDILNSASGYENPYPDGTVLTEFGMDYNDFYTPKYIASYYIDPKDAADSGSGYAEHKYQELCYIDTETYFGTADEPLYPGKHLWTGAGSTSCSIGHYLDGSYLNCGLTVQYADDMPDYVSCIPDNLIPPVTSDRDTFFETIQSVYANPPSYSRSNYNGYQFSDVQKATVYGHDLEYMELTYTDSAGNEIFDVFSFEKKPLSSAFITEYRCLADEISDGVEALELAYSMLDFYADDFEIIDASRYPYSTARIYNSKNTHSATIDVNGLDLGALRHSNMRYKYLVTFELGEYGTFGESACEITLRYRDSNTVEKAGGMEAWAQEMVSDESFYGKFSEEIPEENLTSFTYNDCEAYYLVFDGTEKLYNNTENVRHHKCRIETPEGGEIQLDVKFTHDIPEDFDVVGFLDEHVTIE